MVYDINRILPENKSRFEDLEEFTNRIKRNIVYQRYIEPTDELDEIIPTLYGLDDEVYEKIRKKARMDYIFFKRNAEFINKMIVSSDKPLDNINVLLEVHKGKLAIINRCVSDFKSNKKSDYIAFGEKLLDSEFEAVKDCRQKFVDRFSGYEGDSLFGEYYEKELKLVQSDLLAYFENRYKNFLCMVEKAETASTKQYITDSINRLNKKR